MSINDAANLALALLLVAALAVAGSFAFLTAHDRRTVAAATGNGLRTSAFHGWNLTVNVLLTCWVLASWRRVTRNLGLAYTDKHAIKRVRTIDDKGVITERERPKVTYPWLLARPDAYGVVLTVWTRVGVGRREWEDVAEHLANAWRCHRVHVTQRRPGRVTIRGLRRDPLAAGLSLPVPVPDVSAHLEGGDEYVRHRTPA